MVYPSERQKLVDGQLGMGRLHKRDVRQLLHRQNTAVVDVTVQVTASLIVSVDVDANGLPTTVTTTLTPDAAVPSHPSPALTPAPGTYTPELSSVAATTAAPASNPISSTGSTNGTSSTTPEFSSLSPAGNSTSVSISASNPGPLPAVISVLTGNNATIIAAGASSRTSRLTSSSLSPLPTSTPDSSLSILLGSSSLRSSVALSGSRSDSIVPTGITVAGDAPGAPGSAATGVPNGARNGTTKPNNDNSTSPPVVAGAVVGSVGGMAVILLILVLVARWWKHHSRLEENPESTLHLNGIDGAAPTSRRSFLAAGGWLDRLSGTNHNRSSSPTLPPVTENERGFQKIAGRKLPSQFPTGTEEGPMARDFSASALPPIPAPRASHMSDTSSYYRDSRDTTHFFGSALQIPPLFAGATSNSHLQNHTRAGSSHLTPESSPFDDSHSETLMPSPARTPQIHAYPNDHHFNLNQPPHPSWPSPEDAIQPAPRQ